MVSFFDWIKRNRKFFLPLVGIAAFLLYIMLFKIDLITLVSIAARINVLLYVAAVMMGVASIFFFAVSWKVLLSFQKINFPLEKLFLFVLYSFYMDIIVPAGAVTGDATRVYLIGRDEKGSETKTAASVLTQRLLGMALNVLTLVLGIALILAFSKINTTVVLYVSIVGAAISLGLVLLIVLIAKKSWSIRIVRYSLAVFDTVTRKKWDASRWKGKINELVERFRSSMAAFENNPRVLANSFIYLIINWICTFSIPYIIFFSLRFPVPLYVVVITASIVAAIQGVPVGLPFEVGIPEITMTTLFIALGVPAGISATVTILSRIITLWFVFVLGFVAQQWLELKPKNQPAKPMDNGELRII